MQRIKAMLSWCSQTNIQIRHETLSKLKKIIILSFRFDPSNFLQMFSSKRHFRFFSSQLRALSVRSPSTFSGKWGYWSNESWSDAVGIVLEENSSDFWKGSDFLHLDFFGRSFWVVTADKQQTNGKLIWSTKLVLRQCFWDVFGNEDSFSFSSFFVK